MNDYLPVLVILGFGGLVIWILTKQQQPPQPTIDKSAQAQCGASYAGTGVSVPCSLIAAGIKQLSADAQQALKPVTTQLKTATSGIKPIEYVVTPVAITHIAYNETKAALNYLNPF